MLVTRKVKLVLVSSSRNDGLRTQEVTGFTSSIPTIGEEFVLASESLTPGGIIRLITTSPVKEVYSVNDYILFTTQNSIYKLFNVADVQPILH